MGGKPSKGTKKDRRLKENQPAKRKVQMPWVARSSRRK